MASNVLLTSEDRELLTKVSDLLEEVVETVNVLEDKEAMKAIKCAERDVKAKRVRPYREFIAELKEAGEI